MSSLAQQSAARFSLTFLAEASQILSRSLDPAETIGEIARLFVPLLADVCTIDLIERGTWHRVAASHVEEAKAEALGQKVEAFAQPRFLKLLDEALRLGEPVRLEQIVAPTDETAPTDHYNLVSKLIGWPESGAVCAVAIPLMAGGRIFGITTLALCRAGRSFTTEEVALAAELARRAATALDNARLYRDAERSRAQAESARALSQFFSNVSESLAHAVRGQQALGQAAELAIGPLGTACVLNCRGPTGRMAWAHSASDDDQKTALHALISCDRVSRTQEIKLTPEQLLEAGGNVHPITSFIFTVRGDKRGAFAIAGPSVLNQDGTKAEFQALCEEFLRRVANAIDRAWLFYDLESAITMRDEFLSIASHELRTPLTALELQLGNLSRLLLRPEPWKHQIRFVEKLQRATGQTTRLAKLIDNLLDVSRISAGQFRLDPEPLDLRILCYTLVERWSDEALASGSTLIAKLDHACLGSWDPMRLEQVITNLLSNAVKYGAGQPIRFELKADNEKVYLAVIDHGIGIAEASLERIFNRFERAVSSREFGGLGLGLFITREIVEAHGGTIKVHSVLKEGSSFLVELPLITPFDPTPTTLEHMLKPFLSRAGT